MRRDDAKRLISALIRRRHNDALRIKKLKRHCDLDIAGQVIIGLGGGSIVGLLLGKYILPKIINKIQLSQIKEGDYPEEAFLQLFKTYFSSGPSFAKRFIEPEIWANTGEDEYNQLLPKVMRARRVSDLVRLFPDHKYLKEVETAYKQLY